jgi:HJR/Mrr/RecB family endonuclease
MDKKFWDIIGIILVLSNALGVVVLLEMIFFKFPYISVFLIIFYFVWEMNKKMFMGKHKNKAKNVDRTLSGKYSNNQIVK